MLSRVGRGKDLRTTTRIRIFNTNVKAVLLYSSETSRVTITSISSTSVSLRIFLRVYCPGVIANRDLWLRTGQESINTYTIKRRSWEWIGHTLRQG